jgi:D-alanyl-D-alanine carboxypeptidase (penicillin-binding protein 5/6)
VDGLKTGHTDAAGYCLAASASRDGMRLISVVLGAKSDKARTIHSQALLNYGFKFFEAPRLYDAGEVLKTVRVWYGDRDRLALGLEQPVSVLIPKGRYKDLKASIEVNAEITAPVGQGQELGRLTVRLDDETLVTRPLVALQSVNDGGLVKKALDSVKKLFE